MKSAILGAGELIVARAGYDAETDTDPRHMVIDTRVGRYLGVYAGPLAVDMSQFALTKNGVWKVYSQVVPLGKTFARPPVVRAMYRSIYRAGAMSCYAEGWAGAVQDGNGNWTNSGGMAVAGFGVTTESITFYVAHISYTTTIAGPSAISYIVAHS